MLAAGSDQIGWRESGSIPVSATNSSATYGQRAATSNEPKRIIARCPPCSRLLSVGSALDTLPTSGLRRRPVHESHGSRCRRLSAQRTLDDNVETTSGKVSISTMHLAKGLEFRTVVVMACDDDVIPQSYRAASPSRPLHCLPFLRTRVIHVTTALRGKGERQYEHRS